MKFYSNEAFWTQADVKPGKTDSTQRLSCVWGVGNSFPHCARTCWSEFGWKSGFCHFTQFLWLIIHYFVSASVTMWKDGFQLDGWTENLRLLGFRLSHCGPQPPQRPYRILFWWCKCSAVAFSTSRLTFTARWCNKSLHSQREWTVKKEERERDCENAAMKASGSLWKFHDIT